jgi:hypothetical protein
MNSLRTLNRMRRLTRQLRRPGLVLPLFLFVTTPVWASAFHFSDFDPNHLLSGFQPEASRCQQDPSFQTIAYAPPGSPIVNQPLLRIQSSVAINGNTETHLNLILDHGQPTGIMIHSGPASQPDPKETTFTLAQISQGAILVNPQHRGIVLQGQLSGDRSKMTVNYLKPPGQGRQQCTLSLQRTGNSWVITKNGAPVQELDVQVSTSMVFGVDGIKSIDHCD